MKFDQGIDRQYRQSVEKAFEAIVAAGNDEHLRVANHILDSKMLVRVLPVSKVKASGVTGLISARNTNGRIDDRLSVAEAFDEIFITIALETIDTGGQRGCEGTFVHEGRHAFDFAQTIASFSDADVNPLSVFDPSLYELEWEAHRTSGEYMLRVGRDEYIEEGIQLLILGKNSDGGCFLNDEGIRCRLRDNYGLNLDTNPGPLASELLGLKQP
ncbi:MAG: hypothetical protein ACR2IH_10025 [Pyrinomonadaceae bacterium]